MRFGVNFALQNHAFSGVNMKIVLVKDKSVDATMKKFNGTLRTIIQEPGASSELELHEYKSETTSE